MTRIDETGPGGAARIGIAWASYLGPDVEVLSADASKEDLLNAIAECDRQQDLINAAGAELLRELAERSRGDSRRAAHIVRRLAEIHSITEPDAERLLAESLRDQAR